MEVEDTSVTVATTYGRAIQRLNIANYQSLRKVTLELGKFTVIQGESDVGKSSILRALRALVTNASGQGFITYGKKHAAVELVLGNGTTVQWLKDSSSAYFLLGSDGTQQDFRRTGRQVPSEVAQVLRLGPVKSGDAEIEPGFHGQFSGPFLVTETPSARAKILGELSGINLLYLAVQETRRREAADRKSFSERSQALQAAQERLEAMGDLKKRATLLAGLSEQINAIQIRLDTAEAMRSAADAIDQAREERQELSARVDALNKTADILGAVRFRDLQSAEEMRVWADEIEEARAVHLQTRKDIRSLERRSAELADRLSEVKVCPTCGQPILREELAHA